MATEKPPTCDSIGQHFVLDRFMPYRLSVLANTVSQGLARTYQDDFGLSVPEWRVMAVLGQFSNLTASEVCEQTVMDKVTVSRAVKALLSKGYVVREPDDTDRRRLRMRISEPLGTNVLKKIVPAALQYEQDLLAQLDRYQLETLGGLVHKLTLHARALNSDPS